MDEKLRLLKIEQQYLSIISEFAVDLLAMNSTDEVIWHVAHKVVSRLGFTDVVIYMLEEERKVLIQKAAYGNKNPEAYEILKPIEILLGAGVVGEVALSQKAIIIQDTRRHPSYIIDDQTRLSELAVPIVINGKLFGVIDSEHEEIGFYDQNQLRIVTAIASMVATKLEKIYMVTQLEKTMNNPKYALCIPIIFVSSAPVYLKEKNKSKSNSGLSNSLFSDSVGNTRNIRTCIQTDG